MAQILQINRQYELIIGDGVTGEAVVITPPIGLSFSVDKSSTILRKQDTGQIQIYNLSDETLQKLQGNYPVAVLSVGYQNQANVTILRGEVISVSTQKSGTDKVTTIQIGSGYVDLNHSSVGITIPEGKSVKEVIIAIAQAAGITRGVYSGFGIQKKVLYGYPVSGTVNENLTTICKTYHLDFRIDNGILYVHDADGTTDENYVLAPVVSESSGMIDFPYDTKVDVGRAKKSVDNKSGVHFKILLNPILQAGSIVKIESRTINGFYKIMDVRHTGGNRNSNWYSECRCEEKNAVLQSELDTAQSEDMTDESL